jgi:hypothetical protein
VAAAVVVVELETATGEVVALLTVVDAMAPPFVVDVDDSDEH